jgi:hypothetical protein
MRLVTLLALVVTLLALPGLASQPSLSFESDTVVARGITPGGAAAFAIAARARGDWLNHVIHLQTVVGDDDADGVVTLTRKEGLPEHTVAVVVDVTSGEIAFASPGDEARRQPRPLPPGLLYHAANTAFERVTENASRLDILLVRQGEGAWAASVFDGGPLDADTVEDGVVTAAFSGMRPLGAARKAVDAARAGDVLVLIDPITHDFAAARIPPGKQ